MTPRPYQSDCELAIDNGCRTFLRQLAVLPTGAGKTIIAAMVSKKFIDSGKRVLFLAHREELLTQTLDKFSVACGIKAELEKAESYASFGAKAVVGSIQTFSSRGTRWPENHFDLIIVDEAHHVMAKSYLNILGRFSESKVLGITATPDRMDKKNLGKYFQNVAYEISLLELIRQKYLCPIKVKSIPLKIDLTKVAMSGGDYDESQLAEVLEPYLREIARVLCREAAWRRTLVFCPLIATSKNLCSILQEEGLNADHVDGYDPERKEKAVRFAAGEVDVMCNAMLWTEGFDSPGIDCVLVLRPTKSRGLYSQMVGRGTRIAPNKEDLLLLDFLWMHEKHNLVKPAHLIAQSDEIADEMTEKVAAGGGQVEFDLDDLATETQTNRESRLMEELKKKAKRKARVIDAMEFMLSMHVDYEPTMEWESRPISDGQRTTLTKAKIDMDTVTCSGQASKIIDLIVTRSRMNLCTIPQMQLLKRLKVHNAESVSFSDASKIISQLKQKAA